MLPNFLIIGAAKSGTTSLYEYLKQHPQIFVSPIKEPRFFAFEGRVFDFAGPGDLEGHRLAVTTLQAYKDLFRKSNGARAIGEASPIYLYSPEAWAHIRYYVPHVKMIAVLRNPVDRAYSSYLMMVRDGRENLDFEQALEMEQQRIQSNWEYIWHYARAGLYHVQLKRYYDTFSRSQLRVFLHDQFRDTPLKVVQETYEFLGVDPSFKPDVWVKHNVSAAAFDLPHRVRRRLFRSAPARALKPYLPVRFQNQMEKVLESHDVALPELSPILRRQLQDFFREDILRLEQLIQVDLSHWLR